MTLFQQFQAFIGSIFFGFIFCHFWYVFNRLFYKWEGTLKRFIFEVPVFITFTYLYFLFLVHICSCQLNLFYLFCIALGLFLYVKFYAPKFNKFHEMLIDKFKTKFGIKIHLFFKKIKEKIKTKLKKKVKEKQDKD